MPKGIPLTEEEHQRRREEIFEASVHLFLEAGFNETSMRAIAKAAGVGKSTLYDYFSSKDEILIFYFENVLREITKNALKISQQDLGVKDKLVRVLQMQLVYMVANKNLFLLLSLEAQRLSPESQARIQMNRHAYQDMLRGLIEEGMRQGEFRATDSLLAVRSLFSLLSSAVYTTRPTGTAEEMFNEALAIFFTGIQAR